MKKLHEIGHVAFHGNRILLTVDGRRYRIPLDKASHRLLHATPEQRRVLEISPSGYGIHWPLLDEDLSVAGLLKYSDYPSTSRKTA